VKYRATSAALSRPQCAGCGAEMDRYDGPTPNGQPWFVCPNRDCDDDEGHGSEQDDGYAGLL
jgi:hypothetical protein